MKTLLIKIVLVLTIAINSFGQNTSPQKEFTSIDDALINPELVFRLNLSNQEIKLNDEQWSKFINLEYLNLRGDDLKEIPIGITKLKSLKILDLSNNKFKTLPDEFINLINLEEIYLNDEKNINLPVTLSLLSKLPRLKSIHLENDNLSKLPAELLLIKNLEYLYLNDNKFNEIPRLDELDHLKYLDLKNNKIKPELLDMKNLNFGFKINF